MPETQLENKFEHTEEEAQCYKSIENFFVSYHLRTTLSEKCDAVLKLQQDLLKKMDEVIEKLSKNGGS